MHVRLDFSSRITNNIFARKGQHTQQTTNDKAKTGTKKKQRSKQSYQYLQEKSNTQQTTNNKAKKEQKRNNETNSQTNICLEKDNTQQTKNKKRNKEANIPTKKK